MKAIRAKRNSAREMKVRRSSEFNFQAFIFNIEISPQFLLFFSYMLPEGALPAAFTDSHAHELSACLLFPVQCSVTKLIKMLYK